MANGKYEAWFTKADNILSSQIGLGILDLEDWLWYDAWEDGFSPAAAVKQFKEDIGVNF